MTPEQKFMWDHLCNNYSKLTHKMATEIAQSDKRWLHRKANKFLAVVNTWPIEDAVSAVATWLTIYNIRIVPRKLSNFDAFHDRCSAYIHTCKNIEKFPIITVNKEAVNI